MDDPEFDVESILKEGAQNSCSAHFIPIDMSLLENEQDMGVILEQEVVDNLLPILQDKLMSLEKGNQGAMLASDMSEDIASALVLLNSTVRRLGPERGRCLLLNLRSYKILHVWVETVKQFLNKKSLDIGLGDRPQKKTKSGILYECEKFLSMTGRLLEEKTALEKKNSTLLLEVQDLKLEKEQLISKCNLLATENSAVKKDNAIKSKMLVDTQVALDGETSLTAQLTYKVEELTAKRTGNPEQIDRLTESSYASQGPLDLLVAMAKELKMKGDIPVPIRNQLLRFAASGSKKFECKVQALLEPTPIQQSTKSCEPVQLTSENHIKTKQKRKNVSKRPVQKAKKVRKPEESEEPDELQKIGLFYDVLPILSPLSSDIEIKTLKDGESSLGHADPGQREQARRYIVISATFAT
ncbi:hypothetical protein B566_EDAN016028 [Ephemera danica]|nr:hypothetical protein B566_EDAN016028 [Ephemera danica]